MRLTRGRFWLRGRRLRWLLPGAGLRSHAGQHDDADEHGRKDLVVPEEYEHSGDAEREGKHHGDGLAALGEGDLEGTREHLTAIERANRYPIEHTPDK